MPTAKAYASCVYQRDKTPRVYYTLHVGIINGLMHRKPTEITATSIQRFAAEIEQYKKEGFTIKGTSLPLGVRRLETITLEDGDDLFISRAPIAEHVDGAFK